MTINCSKLRMNKTYCGSCGWEREVSDDELENKEDDVYMKRVLTGHLSKNHQKPQEDKCDYDKMYYTIGGERYNISDLHYRDVDWLREQVEEKNRSFYSIAKNCDRDEKRVREFAHKNGIYRPLKSKEILQQHIEDGYNIEEMCDKWDCDGWEINLAFSKLGMV